VLTRKPSAGEPGLYLSASTEQYKRNRALGANKTDYNIQADDRRILTARVMENYVVADMGAVALGVEARRDRGDATNRRWPGGTPGPNYTWNQDLNLRTYGAFAQGQYKPIASLKLIGGARVDRLDYDIANRKLPAASVTYHKSVATPRGGVVWTPLGSLDLFANIGQGYRSPNQTEISPSGSLGPLGASGGTPYPDLAPPKVTSKDAGATLYGSTWRLTGARYHTLNESEIIQVSPGVFSTVGNTIRDGWEVEATMTPTGTIDAYASYGRIMQARILSAAAGQADRVPVPRDTWKGGLGYHAPFGVMLDVDASYISRVPYFAGSPLTLVYTRQYTRFDARATRGVGQLDVTAFATAQPVEYGAEAASAVSAGLLIDPRPKSELGVSVRYRFGRY
jgi:outer membrane receptor protein involved in Fe transport